MNICPMGCITTANGHIFHLAQLQGQMDGYPCNAVNGVGFPAAVHLHSFPANLGIKSIESFKEFMALCMSVCLWINCSYLWLNCTPFQGFIFLTKYFYDPFYLMIHCYCYCL